MLPLLEAVQKICQTDPRRRQELQQLLQEVNEVLRACYVAMDKWTKPSGVTGVSGLQTASLCCFQLACSAGIMCHLLVYQTCSASCWQARHTCLNNPLTLCRIDQSAACYHLRCQLAHTVTATMPRQQATILDACLCVLCTAAQTAYRVWVADDVEKKFEELEVRLSVCVSKLSDALHIKS